jgi:hypothetical protein
MSKVAWLPVSTLRLKQSMGALAITTVEEKAPLTAIHIMYN